MAVSQSRRLDASAPAFVRKMSFVPQQVLELYVGPPAVALPPVGFYYPRPVLIAPPAPGFPRGGCWGFPPGHCVGMQGASPSPGWAPLTPVAMGMPAATAGMQCAPQPQMPGMSPATLQGGRHRRSRSVRTGLAHGARLLPRLDVPPRMQRAAYRAAAPSPSRGAEIAGAGKVEPPANEPSPRSVLVQTSPPVSPSALPTFFPYPELGSPSQPASEGAPSSASVPADGSQPVVPPQRRLRERAPRRFCQTGGGTVRRGDPKPRRLFDPSSSNTSLMIRNLPNDFRRTRMMQIIDQHCAIENDEIKSGGIKSEYDFLYLPMDFSTGANKGFAFVNVTTPEAARRLHAHLHGHRWKVNGSGKTCEVDHADVKGLEKLVNKLSGSRFDCGDEEFLPVWFEPPRDGTRTSLPHLVGRMLRLSL